MDYQSIFERVESKYVLTKTQYEGLWKKIGTHLVDDAFPHSSISSIYFDTDNYSLARTSIDKSAYREKLRLRSYGLKNDDSEVFLELKKKYNGIIYKRRQGMSYRDSINYILFDKKPVDTQIMSEIDYLKVKYPDLAPRVLISYERDSFAGKEDKQLRITFDYDIRYSLDNLTLKGNKADRKLSDDDTIIMEIKSLKSMPLWLSHSLDELGILPGTFSKYGQIYTKVIMKGVKPCSKIYSHQSTAVQSHSMYSSFAQLHQSY